VPSIRAEAAGLSVYERAEETGQEITMELVKQVLAETGSSQPLADVEVCGVLATISAEGQEAGGALAL
jgi:hypothetical protein